MMEYEESMSDEEVKKFPTPHMALEALKLSMSYKIHKDGKNPNHYITQTANVGKGLKMTARYSEARKQHFDKVEG